MNLKKVLAAISAAAVAVSAMATSISAFDEQTIKFNLVQYRQHAANTNGSIVLTQRVNSAATVFGIPNTGVEADNGVTKILKSWGIDPTDAGATITVTGVGQTGERLTYTFTRNRAANLTNFNSGFEATGTVTLPAGLFADDAGLATSAVTVTLTYPVIKTESDFNKKDLLIWLNDGDGITSLATGNFTASYATTGLEGYLERLYAITGATFAAGTSTGVLSIAPLTGPDFGEAATISNATGVFGPVLISSISYKSPAHVVKQWKQAFVTGLHTYPYNDIIGISDIYNANTNNLVNYPNYGTDVDIIGFLQQAPLRDWGSDKSYSNARAVINDAWANYDSITVKFNTVTEDVCIEPQCYYWGSVGNCSNWAPNTAHAGTGHRVTGYYKVLSPQLYDRFSYSANLNDDITFTDTGYAGYNFGSLMQGALLVNSAWTMSLNDINMVTYGTTSVEFSLDKLFSGENRQRNNAADISSVAQSIYTLQFATSTLWFWDSMELICAAGLGEDAETGAGIQESEEMPELDEEPEWEEEVEEPEWVDEPEVDEPEIEYVEVPAPVENPTTGNASVALAIIPVALAAAVIVIKKRK